MGDEKLVMSDVLVLKRAKLRILQANAKFKSIVGAGYDDFCSSRKRYRVLKGGRASKKSTTTALWFIHYLMQYPLANAVVVRKIARTNNDSTFAQLQWAARKLGVYEQWKFTTSPLEAVYRPTGQKILFRGFDDVFKLTSITVEVGYLCWVWLEECYEIDSEKDFKTLDESIRGMMPKGLWKQLTITYNPWVSSHWTKDRFWDNVDPNADTFTTTYKCNEYLDEADRKLLDELEFTDPERYKVVGRGEYGTPGGTYFDEFRREIHVCQPFSIPSHWRKYRVIDYGLDMLACYWIATDTHNKAYVYQELYEPNLIISEAAKKMIDMTPKGDQIYDTLAPPDLWNRRQETGKSAAEIFSDNGVWLTKANNDRIQGWYNVKEWLKPYKDEQGINTANLIFFDNCKNVIRCISQIQKDTRNSNDCANEPHELTHSCDSIRYWIASRPCLSIAPVKEDHPVNSLEWKVKKHLDSMIKSNKRKDKYYA